MNYDVEVARMRLRPFVRTWSAGCVLTHPITMPEPMTILSDYPTAATVGCKTSYPGCANDGANLAPESLPVIGKRHCTKFGSARGLPLGLIVKRSPVGVRRCSTRCHFAASDGQDQLSRFLPGHDESNRCSALPEHQLGTKHPLAAHRHTVIGGELRGHAQHHSMPPVTSGQPTDEANPTVLVKDQFSGHSKRRGHGRGGDARSPAVTDSQRRRGRRGDLDNDAPPQVGIHWLLRLVKIAVGR
jgi:hypothetical protein